MCLFGSGSHDAYHPLKGAGSILFACTGVVMFLQLIGMFFFELWLFGQSKVD